MKPIFPDGVYPSQDCTLAATSTFKIIILSSNLITYQNKTSKPLKIYYKGKKNTKINIHSTFTISKALR
jgi:hypothetical protein